MARDRSSRYKIDFFIAVKRSHGPLVTQSLSHLVTRSLGYKVTRSLGHSVTWKQVTRSLGHSVNRSLGHSLTRSLGLSVTWLLVTVVTEWSSDRVTEWPSDRDINGHIAIDRSDSSYTINSSFSSDWCDSVGMNAQCTTVACCAQYSCTTMQNKHAQC